ncbi:uncharacterized protein C8R40DRAFT_1256436 [Lentinula edodes]|uniref:uncharacterized protein n=1 Tax=Lentinula edodes TaxID=5353 RepID=UPI001E8D94D5|nr:uncharacterized protein C8R40DRAFT_1256436 [Lentinula edodes]KAH7871551.1 hypothetical protein C8R40DRAFT_1256436 [Lentinula edodes]
MSVPPEDLSPTLIFRHRTRLNSDRAYSDWHPSTNSPTSTEPTSPTTRNRLLLFLTLRRHYFLILTLSFLVSCLLLSVCHVLGNAYRARYQQAFLKPNQPKLSNNTIAINIANSRKSKTYIPPRPFSKASSNEIEASGPFSTAHKLGSTRTGAVPVVYRTVLERLEQLDRQQEALLALPISLPFLDVENQYHYFPKTVVNNLCRDSLCRFLLPLRIAEQESKARIHLLEIIQTAKRLDRILVLPRVGKSRLGLCFRWSFEAYYDEDMLQETLHEEGVRSVTLEAFKLWLDSGPVPSPRGQLVSLSSKVDSNRPGTVNFTDNNNRLITFVDNDPLTLQDPRLPGCFGDRFSALILNDFTPVAIYPSPVVNKSLKKQPVGEEFISILGREDIRNASRFPALGGISPKNEPEVLMLDWGMRHPVYSQPFKGPITYSPLLERLATTLSSPSSPYLTIHWRMESVSPDVLPDCAHDLVDTISNLLHSPDLSEGIQKVWFSGDYPVPLVEHLYPTSDRAQTRATIQNKSGTFRDFGEKHTEAVNILVDAFREGAELDRWTITDLTAELARMEKDNELHDVHPEFLADSGALGILDKMVGMDAAIFVGGSKRCGRTSSFTKQVIDSRQKFFEKDGLVRNVVEYFG